MDSATRASPLPDDSLVRGGPSDPAAIGRTIGLNDPRVMAWLKAGVGSGTVVGQTTKALRGRLTRALEEANFRLSFEASPSFAAAQKHGATGRTVNGRLIGEAALVVTTEGVESKRRVAKAVGVFGLAFAIAMAILLYILAPGAVFLGVLSGVAIAACGAIPLILTLGEFDSDVVAIAYSGSYADPIGTFDENTPVTFQVTIASGRVRSRNGSGKGHTWRDVNTSLPASKDLEFVPGQILDAVGAQ